MSNINRLKQSYEVLGDFAQPTITVSSTSPAQVSAYGNSYSRSAGDFPQRRWVITLADMQGLGAFTAGDILLAELPAGAMVTRTVLKHETALTDAVGGSGSAVALSASTARILTVAQNAAAAASAIHSFGTAYDVFAAPSNTAIDVGNPTAAFEAWASPTWLICRFSATGANLGALTNGKIYCFVDYIVFSE